MNKLLLMKEYLSKEQLRIIMLLKHKSNISLDKYKRLLLNMSLLKELMKGSNIYLFKHKSYTIPKEKNMLDRDPIMEEISEFIQDNIQVVIVLEDIIMANI